jgi:hypothetical protein
LILGRIELTRRTLAALLKGCRLGQPGIAVAKKTAATALSTRPTIQKGTRTCQRKNYVSAATPAPV